MNAIRGVPAVFRFEWKRSFSVPRMVWWVLLTAFPPVLFGMIRLLIDPPAADSPQSAAFEASVPIMVSILCPGVVCMMGVFLWATPAITSELQGQSWVYLAVRPHGAISVLLGKYLVAVTWTLPAGLIASAMSVLILAPQEPGRLVWVEWRLVLLSCVAYSAVFMLIGVLFTRRTMAVGVFYVLFVEVFLAMIPAVVNSFTIQFRLRCLLVRWMGWNQPIVSNNPDAGPFQAYFGEESDWWHLGVLLGMTAALLVAAALILRWRQFTTSAETDA